ncbi:MAG TPA: ABC transporter permease [Solirubrobacteraceae bacterium]|nr:ABC transporter permease [Solirubrobacteraceae bacterium]
MSSTVCYLGAVLATMKRDALIFVSYRLRVFSQAVAMLFSLTIFYYVGKLVPAGAIGPHGKYFAFAVVGIVTTAVLTSALGSVQIVRMELMQGNFERILISPLGPVWGVVAVVAFPIAYSTVFAGVMLALASLIFGVPLHVGGIAPALAVGLLGALCLACIGLLFVAALIAFKSSLGATWVIAGLSLLGGAYFPLRLFPGWIRWTSDVQPYTPTVDLLRHLLVGTRPVQAVWLELIKLAGFAALLMPVSITILWLAVKLSRHRGTIMEF